jgi:hypothetical protein
MIERDEMIREALFCINANNLLNDFADANKNTRNILYSIYDNAIRYVTNLSQIGMLQKRIQANKHPFLGDGWYYMPLDFVAWAEKIDPTLEYCIDEDNMYAVKLMKEDICYLSFADPISELDVYFRQSVKWQFLNELSLSDGTLVLIEDGIVRWPAQ